MRCLYHFFLGLVLSVIWLVVAVPYFSSCSGLANTTEYWAGLFALVTLLACRAARHTQRQLRGLEIPKGEQAQMWGRICGPYLCEFPSYLLASWVLGFDSDTLGVLHSSAAPALRGLALLCLILSLPCASTLGWKLAHSKLPALLPILAAGSALIVCIPGFYRLNRVFIANTFPLLPVSLVALGFLLFLLSCCRTRVHWWTTFRKPHPALGLACFMPATPLGICLLAFAGGWAEGLEAVSFALSVTLFSGSLTYFVLCCSPLRPTRAKALFPCAFACGALATYALFSVSGVHLYLEAAKLPTGDMMVFLIFGGLFGAVAPALERKSQAPGPPA